MYQVVPQGPNLIYSPAHVAQVLNAVEILADSPDVQRALDAVAAAFGVRRVPVASNQRQYVTVIEASGREVSRR